MNKPRPSLNCGDLLGGFQNWIPKIICGGFFDQIILQVIFVKLRRFLIFRFQPFMFQGVGILK